ncbi:MAG: ABC transporter permease [Eubacteriales bacterium]
MKIKQAFFLAIKSLATSKMRALLTMLGIIIGVAAVIVIISLGAGLQQMMEGEFESLGTNLIQTVIKDSSGGSSRSATPEDMHQIVFDNPQYLKACSPSVSLNLDVRSERESFSPNTLSGVSEEYLQIRSYQLSSGRFLQYVDVLRMQNVCVVGSYINEEYYEGSAVGKTMGIGGYTYEIVGVLDEIAESLKGTDDDQILIPYTNAVHLSGNTPSSYMFSGVNSDTASTARSRIESALDKIYGSSDSYMVVTSAEMLDIMNTMMDTLMFVLVAIAAISLLVGGIGIMNIMLVSVTERTREIGIRKSLGAKQKDIRSQFIIEAATTSSIGGIIGIGLGIAAANVASFVVENFTDVDGFSAAPTADSIIIAFSVSVAVGVIFGYLPANKASQLNPIDALRYD